MIAAAEQQLQRARDFLGTIPRAAEQAMARALNRAVAAGREQAVESITTRYAVRASDIRDKVSIRTASPDRLTATVVAKSGSLSLTYFPHSPTEAGTGGPGRPPLRAEVLRGQEKAVPHAFIATINGKPRIMYRTGQITASGKAAIKSLSTVPMGAMMGAESVRAAVEVRALAVLDEHLDREIDRALGKVG